MICECLIQQYSKITLQKDRGDLWFCSEKDAKAAGFIRTADSNPKKKPVPTPTPALSYDEQFFQGNWYINDRLHQRTLRAWHEAGYFKQVSACGRLLFSTQKKKVLFNISKTTIEEQGKSWEEWRQHLNKIMRRDALKLQECLIRTTREQLILYDDPFERHARTCLMIEGIN